MTEERTKDPHPGALLKDVIQDRLLTLSRPRRAIRP